MGHLGIHVVSYLDHLELERVRVHLSYEFTGAESVWLVHVGQRTLEFSVEELLAVGEIIF